MQTYKIQRRSNFSRYQEVFLERQSRDEVIDFLNTLKEKYDASISLGSFTARTTNFYYQCNPEQ